MSTFVKHGPCTHCGSKDNLAHYLGGSSYCFGCGYSGRGNISPYVFNAQVNEETSSMPELPEDVGELPKEGQEWLAKYGITIPEALQRDITGSIKQNQIIFQFFDRDTRLGDVQHDGRQNVRKSILWQARNFSVGRKKYFTAGTPDSVLPIYYGPKTGDQQLTCLALVEDCVSAIKIARQCDAMPCLSSDLSRNKLTRLAAYYGPSCPIVVWLDGDMFHKAQKIADRLNVLGCRATAVYTSLDPKEYSDEEISAVLQKTLDKSL